MRGNSFGERNLHLPILIPTYLVAVCTYHPEKNTWVSTVDREIFAVINFRQYCITMKIENTKFFQPGIIMILTSHVSFHWSVESKYKYHGSSVLPKTC